MLRPQEEDHARLFRIYNGRTAIPLDLTGCGSAELRAQVTAIRDAEAAQRAKPTPTRCPPRSTLSPVRSTSTANDIASCPIGQEGCPADRCAADSIVSSVGHGIGDVHDQLALRVRGRCPSFQERTGVNARKRPQLRSEEHVASGEFAAHPARRELRSEWLTASAAPGLRHQPAWARTVLGLQRSAGNLSVVRMLARVRSPVQRQDGDRPAIPPTTSGSQLTMPELGSSAGWRPPSAAGSQFRLHLDPGIEAHLRAMQVMRALTSPEQVSAGLDLLTLPSVPLSLLPPGSISPGAPALPAPPPPSAATAVGPAPGTELTGPRPGTGGDIWRAIKADPGIGPAVLELQDQAATRARQDWRALSSGGQIAVVSTVVVIGGGAVAGVLSNREARSWVANTLSGQVLPVPKVPGLGIQLNLRANDVLLGLHLDVGQLLPTALGFGPAASTSALGAPPNPYAPIP